MSASRSSPLAAALLLLAVLGPPLAVSAQEVLVPVPLAPAPGSEPTPPEPVPVTAPGSPAPLAPLTPLPATTGVSLDEIGTLDAADGGLGWDLWAGTDRRVLEGLLHRLPVNLSSPTLYSLATRLLLSKAAVPPPSQATAGEAPETNSLLSLRLETLAAMGERQGLEALLALVPAQEAVALRSFLLVNGHFARGDVETACQSVQTVEPAIRITHFWQQALLYCHLHAGEQAQLDLGLSLMRELNDPADALFLRLAEALLGLAPLLPADLEALDPNSVTVIELTMLRDSGAELPPALLSAAAAPLRVALAETPGTDLLGRAQAAEWAVSSGRLPPTVLADVYAAYVFTPEQLDDSVRAGYGLSGIEARALSYQAVKATTIPEVASEVVSHGLQRAEADGVFFAAAQVLLPLSRARPDLASFAWFAAPAGRALYALGRYEEATAWLMLAHQEAALSAQAALAANRLWPYSRLAGVASVMSAAGLEGWRSAQSDPFGPEVARRLRLLRVLFQALGEADNLPWIDLAIVEDDAAQQASLPDATLLYALEDASLNGRTGETVLLSLALIGGAPAGKAHPLALSAVLQALSNVGLGLEARALAIEVAIENGI